LSRHFNTLNAEAVSPTTFRSPATPQTPAIGNAHHRDRSAIADDEIMKLVHRVFILPGPTKAPGVVAICGVDQGAGCSWVCARASEALASQTSGTVCAVDANLRSPSLDTHFRIEKSVGFTNAMKDSQPMSAFARRARPDNLWVLTAGAKVSEPNGSLNPERLQEKFSQLRGHFDYVLVDTPPADSYADALLLGQMTDGIILVVGSHLTRRESARMAKESFDGAGIPVIGAVLNKRTFPIPEALYRIL
jgi:capsular exopolysaccharide synthesis family protein